MDFIGDSVVCVMVFFGMVVFYFVYFYFGIGLGDEVIVFVMIYIVIVYVVEWVGVKLVFVDLDWLMGNFIFEGIEVVVME